MAAEKILAAMSGGVDSSVVALLLTEAGYDVTGVMMKLFENEDVGRGVFDPCLSLATKGDAEAVAEKLDIPFYVYNFADDFRENIIAPFAGEYEKGRTPNPCVECNRRIKFGVLFDKAESLGCSRIATGHYAQITYENQRFLLKKGVDQRKDQSYVLFSLTQDKLSRVILPLGGMTKEEVREIALRNDFVNANRKESQDICFVPDGDYASIVENHISAPSPSGDIIDEAGNILGTHEGIINYTVGQRRGLGVSSDRRLFVKEIDPLSNTVVLAENSSLYGDRLRAKNINFIPFDRLDSPIAVTAKIRYGAKEQPATLYQIGEDEIEVVFDSPQRAITKGQYVVMYDGDTVVGGGSIEDSR